MLSFNKKRGLSGLSLPIRVSNFAWTLSLVSLFVILQDFLNWPILQFAKIVSPTKFRDSLWVLEDADCYEKIGSEIFNLEITTGCPAYIYGEPLLKILNFLHIGSEDTQYFVYGMRILFCLALAYILSELFLGIKQNLLVAALVMFSPGVQLMLYNGNIDLLIFSMIIGIYLAFKHNKPIIGFIVLALAGVFKFYTIPLFVIAFLIPFKKRDKIIALILFLMTSISAFWDLHRMKEAIPSHGYAQFGMNIFTEYLLKIGLEISRTQGLLISVLLFLFTTFVCHRMIKVFENIGSIMDSNLKLIYCLLGVVFLTCFFTGLSFDSRLIYLTLCGVIVLNWIPKNLHRNATMGVLVFASLFTCGIELGLIPPTNQGFHPLRVVQLANDIAIEIIASLIFLYLIKLQFAAKRFLR